MIICVYTMKVDLLYIRMVAQCCTSFGDEPFGQGRISDNLNVFSCLTYCRSFTCKISKHNNLKKSIRNLTNTRIGEIVY